jgi:CheY-like chemotaxis protein
MRSTPLSSCFTSSRSSLAPPPPSIRSTSIRVLVVDADAQIRDLLEQLLEAEGYEVSQARDVPHAARLALQKWPDLALLDLTMPGAAGWQFLDLQSENPLLARIPVLVPSKFVADLEVEAAKRNPFLLASFLEAIRHVTGPRAPSSLPQEAPLARRATPPRDRRRSPVRRQASPDAAARISAIP